MNDNSKAGARVIVSLDNNRLKKYLSGPVKGLRYIYTCERDRDKDIVNLLRKKGCIEIGEAGYNGAFRDSLCRAYIDLVGKLSARYNSIYWWTTFVSSKNRFASMLTNSLFSLYSMADRIEKHKDTDILVINSNESVCSSLKKYLKDRNVKFVSLTDNADQSVRAIKRYVKSAASAALFIYRMWKRICISRYYLKKLLKPRIIKDIPYYVIKTFVYTSGSSFDGNNVYRDSFFGALPEYLKGKNKEVLILADILCDYKQVVKKIRDNRTFLVVPQEYLISYMDPVKAVVKTFVNRVVIRDKEKFLDFDVSDIINSEIALDYKRGSLFGEYLYSIYIKKLLKLIKIETFTLTYENNPWEKMCIAALKRCSPSTKIIGYQHTVVPQASANMFISEFEKEIIPLPDKILTVGNIPKKIMERYGCYGEGHVEESCALRFEHLFKISAVPRSRSGRILVALEGIYDVYRLVNYVLKELKDTRDFSVRIRPHPVFPFSRFKNKIKYNIEELPHVSLSDNPSVRNDIEESDIMIYWGSTVALEALMIGKPIIHFDMRNMLSYDPLFENKHLKWTITENDRLADTLNLIYGMDDESFYFQQRCAREYMENYFYKVNEEGLQKFMI